MAMDILIKSSSYVRSHRLPTCRVQVYKKRRNTKLGETSDVDAYETMFNNIIIIS